MRHAVFVLARRATPLVAALALAGCGVRGSTDPTGGAPPPAVVEHENGDDSGHVDHPEQFPLAAATSRDAAPELNVTGVVNPDVSRAVPVV